MERITISVSDEFAAELAAFMASERYDNRSEAVRDLARLGVENLKAQILIRHIMRVDRLGTVKVEAGRPAQADDRLSRRAGAVEGTLADLVQILALEQRQAKSGLRVDV